MELKVEIEDIDIIDQVTLLSLQDAYKTNIEARDEGNELIYDEELLDALTKVIRYYSTEKEYDEFLAKFNAS